MSEARLGPVIALSGETPGEEVEIPAGITDLAKFRAWATSDSFPERGRIDWIAGRMEVDMSPEDLNTHGTRKAAIAAQLWALVHETEKGAVFIDRARLSSPEADLSAEPDIIVLFIETIQSGRARLVPKAKRGPDRFIEVEGTADLVVECVSDASTAKDRKRLREAYHRAGVREYWLVDARGKELEFQVLLHRSDGYAPSPANAEGFVRSEVLDRSFRLVCRRKLAGIHFYRLEPGP